jgi:hypothetical protein
MGQLVEFVAPKGALMSVAKRLIVHVIDVPALSVICATRYISMMVGLSVVISMR